MGNQLLAYVVNISGACELNIFSMAVSDAEGEYIIRGFDRLGKIWKLEGNMLYAG